MACRCNELHEEDGRGAAPPTYSEAPLLDCTHTLCALLLSVPRQRRGFIKLLMS